MGCPYSQEVIHPNQHNQQSEKSNRKAKVFTPKTNSDKRVPSQKSQSHITTENIIQVKQPINGQGLILVEKAISQHFLFYGLNNSQRFQLIKLMRRYSCFKDEYIFKKGDEASTFFIICSGKIQIQTGLQTPKFLEKGSCFGELALIHSVPRSVSVVARQDTILWGVQSSIFHRFMSRVKQKNYNLIRSFIDKLPFFAFMNRKQKQNLVDSCHRFKYFAGEKVFNIKDPATSIFVVMQGRIQMQIPNKPKVLFQKGEMFGEGCLLGDEFRSGTALSIQTTQCLSISKNSLLKQLGIETDNILFYCICKWALKRCSSFQLLKRTIIDKIIFTGQMTVIQDGEIIQAKGQPRNMLFICLQGKINNQGIGSIFNQFNQQSGTKDLVKNQKGFIFMIKFQTLTKIINRPMKTFVQTKQRRIKIKTEHLGSIDDFVILSKIKQTSISQLFQVTTHTNKNARYLLHSFKKNCIIEGEQQVKIHNYIKTLQSVKEHSLIPKIVRIFANDPDYLFLVKAFTGTITLADLNQQIKLSSPDMKFYFASVIEIVSHLHHQNIMHRNISLDSFIIADNGYLYSDQLCQIKQYSTKLIFQTQPKTERTKTISTLPHYLAPEVISGQGHSLVSDLWGIGILMYQIMYGRVPFGYQNNDVMEIYGQILQNNLTFQDWDAQTQKQSPQIQIIRILLKIQRNQRTNLTQIKTKSYFNDFNFQKLKQLSLKAPEIKLKKNIKHEQYKVFPTRLTNQINQFFATQRKFLGEPLTSKKMPNWIDFSK